jgi:hypothetical protein
MKPYQVTIPVVLVFQVQATTKQSAVKKALLRMSGYDLRSYKASEIKVEKVNK